LSAAGWWGTEVGLFLAEQGKEVIFVEMLDEIMNGILPSDKPDYTKRLANKMSRSIPAGGS